MTFNIIQLGGLPIKSWAANLETGTLNQAINLSKLPFAISHIGLMADAHQGYGMPIGGVLAGKDMVIPNGVGVDIGCGVLAVKTRVKAVTRRQIGFMLEETRTRVPMGFKHHAKPQNWEGFSSAPDIKVIKQQLGSARKQLGTLGSGNHFSSIEEGSDGHVWLMVHSGSRNLGLQVAKYYNGIAKEYNRKHSIVSPDYDLAPLPITCSEGREYMSAMEFCLQFARANRRKIMNALVQAFFQQVGDAGIEQEIDVHHNYARMEIHFGQEVVVHRKGATSARQGEWGIVPGSMGTPSYIVRGLGNNESFCSCSHGAGRVMSRKRANQTITEEMADRSMQGIVFRGWGGDYSEAPMAYNDIEQVMANQRDLIEPVVRLTPLGVIKG